MKHLRHLTYILAGAGLLVGMTALAATTDYLLVPDLPFIAGTTDLSGYLKGLFQLGIGIAVTLAIVMLVINGIRYMFSDIAGIKVDAKKNLGNIVWGLILAFGSWLILYTINPNLVEFDLIQSLEKASEQAGSDVPDSPPPPTGVAWPSDANERSFLQGIGVNKSNCTTVGQTNCTSLSGLSFDAMAKLLTLKDNCNCSLTITGGTEYWLHSSHGNNRTVDLSNTFSLEVYLGGQGSTCGDQKTKDGVRFVWEDNSCSWAGGSGFAPHWHVPL